ncbi:TOBE domain-containing protein [Seohaeicola nanhaiensis]|uniref:TOBE domain-containing protein n=1 Tax=Seohaeicola nanhaiensis TaxID=1387282 RepID=A0ABV9KPY8_9RHOB
MEVFVRPEAMRIGPGEDGATLAGTVDSLLFNGANSRVLVRTTGGALVEVADPAADGEGTQVQVSWPAQKALCFPRAAA